MTDATACFRVEVGYRTKRGGVCLGMTVKAAYEDEADAKARKIALDGYPARKWCFSRVSKATRHDIAMGVSE